MIKLNSFSSINNLPLTNEILVYFINKFWDDIFNEIKDTKHLLILCKIKFTNEELGYRTLGHLRQVNYNDKELFIDYLSQRLSILSDSYMTHPISNIIFSYIIKQGQCIDKNRALLQNLDDKLASTHSFNNMNLPVSMSPTDYGEIQASEFFKINGITYHRYIVYNGSKIFRIDRSLDRSHNKVTILGNIDLSWIDTKLNEHSVEDIFTREIKKSTIYFMDGQVVLRKQILPAKAFRRLQADNTLVNEFYTMDIETIKHDRKLNPYLICAYNGLDYITSYGKDQKVLFNTFFDQLLSKVKKGHSAIVYAHNLSGFDGIFLMRHLLEYGKVEPLLFNGRLMSIKLKINGDNKSDTKTLVFKDSYLLLPLSLRKLCKAFNLEVAKGYFPFLLNDVFYSGVIPKFAHWIGISKNEYESLVTEYKGKMWSFHNESVKYCKLDCKCLHEILVKFNILIFNNFNVNVHKSLTLPALAMRIYKSYYMPKDTIYQILGKPEFNIRKSYSGGAVDVYIPHNRISGFISGIKSIFIKLYCYDVNSLYPFVMAFNDMHN